MLARFVLSGAVLVAMLAVAPAAWADPGPVEDTPPAAEAGDSQGAAPADDGAQGPAASAAGDDQPGASADATGHDGTPGNSENAPGHDDPPGNSGEAPGHQNDGPPAGTEQGASVGQTADASAAADQNDVDNTAVVVRVDEPGNGKKVGQENRASAEAGASTASTADTAGAVTVVQDADADASATQSDVANTSIVVRVGSQGDDEGVTQANVATGAANATTLSDQPSIATADATSLAAQDGVANTTVSVRVFSPGDDGPVSQLNAASATATESGGTGSAVARQDAAQNTSVSIRVESPGSVEAPVQENRTTTSGDASAAGGLAIAMAGDGTNTVLTVAVGGTALDRPGAAAAQIWVWTWVWTRDETQELGELTALEPDSWVWNWDGTGSSTTTPGNVTSRPADDEVQGREGSLEWTWDWTRAGVPGWAWNWNRQLTLSCASCIWIWNWSWSWTAQPGADDQGAGDQGSGPTVASPPPGQLNAVSAKATATASSQVAQTVVQDGSGTSTQFAGQLVDVTQDARAGAAAQQRGISSVAWEGGSGQSNTVTSLAGTTLAGSLTQRIEQLLIAAEAASGEQWAGQQAALAQVGSADASSAQHHVLLTGPGSHAATGSAATDAAATVVQEVAQDALSGGGTASQWAGQLVLVEQAAKAATTVKQGGRGRSGRTGGTASGSARAGELAAIAQSAEQAAARDGGTSFQTAAQLAFAGQDAGAHASTDQQLGATVVGEARSEALALTRVKIVQDALQSAGGSSPLLQDLVQQAIVAQTAEASSTSSGGFAGTAFVLDCAVVQQGATQSVAMGLGRPETPADIAFCLPTAAPPTSSPVVLESPTAAGGELIANVPNAAAPEGAAATVGAVPLPTTEANVPSTTEANVPSGPRAAQHMHRSSSAPSALASAGPAAPGISQISAPPSPQARIDTRPGSHAGVGDTGREPPLPPVGDPPSWVSALAAAAAGGGASGIAAILSAFALSTPLLLRAPEGSVVRRPTDVFVPIDVPV